VTDHPAEAPLAAAMLSSGLANECLQTLDDLGWAVVPRWKPNALTAADWQAAEDAFLARLGITRDEYASMVDSGVWAPGPADAGHRLTAERDQAAAALDRVLAECDAIDRERLARGDGDEPLDVAIAAAIRTVQYVAVRRIRTAAKPTATRSTT
jgi:hypothetical protein